MNRVKGLVSIVTLNMNQAHMTAEFLDSLIDSSYSNIEVIVVDQNSKEHPDEILSKAYPNLTLVKSKTNLGFTGGNNLAVKYAKGEYIFCVNNDTIIPRTLIEDLLKPFSEHSNIGIVSPQIIYFHAPTIIQYAGYTVINNITGRNIAIGKHQDRTIAKFNKQYETAYAHGCAMMIPYKVIADVGFLAEDFFIYYEELDFSQRVKDAGYKIWYNGATNILHKESVTTGKNSTFKEYYHTRNRLLFMRRHSKSAHTIFLHWIFFMTAVALKRTIEHIVRGKFKHLKEFYKAILWNLKNSSNRIK